MEGGGGGGGLLLCDGVAPGYSRGRVTFRLQQQYCYGTVIVGYASSRGLPGLDFNRHPEVSNTLPVYSSLGISGRQQ